MRGGESRAAAVQRCGDHHSGRHLWLCGKFMQLCVRWRLMPSVRQAGEALALPLPYSKAAQHPSSARMLCARDAPVSTPKSSAGSGASTRAYMCVCVCV